MSSVFNTTNTFTDIVDANQLIINSDSDQIVIGDIQTTINCITEHCCSSRGVFV